ncbi:hypothetical protein D1AOALGA4SA_4984 [Olavius algarvensis Delta 1 endosymbiont]|nr:hypothetical protein D1AOALGA4SA_4984 [Olavius algarvensis Delta 1 endosymbiont]
MSVPAARYGSLFYIYFAHRSTSVNRIRIYQNGHKSLQYILSQNTWSFGPVVDPVFFTGVRDNRLYRESCCKQYRNDGILESWNAGFSGMGSSFISMALIRF